jgi:3-hydroxyisobutyrate dehydrogenase
MKVGFIGLGTMGGAIALNALKGGHALTVSDLQPDRGKSLLAAGAEWKSTPAEIAAEVDVVLMSLPGPAEVETVVLGPDGLHAGCRKGQICIDLSTNSPTVVRRLHAALVERGGHFLDAPVSGGPSGARSGQLAIWVGGDQAAFERAMPVFRSVSDAPMYVGPIGAGSVAKLVHNLSGYALQTALAEAFTMGVKAGVPAEGLWRAVRQGYVGRRRTFDTMSRQYLPGKFDPADFALELAHKDVGLALEVGREFDVPMRLGNLVLEEMTEALNRGWQRRDSRSAMLLQEERSGAEVRVPLDRIQAIVDEDGE